MHIMTQTNKTYITSDGNHYENHFISFDVVLNTLQALNFTCTLQLVSF